MGLPRLAAGSLCLLVACSACSCARRSSGELAVFPVSGQVLYDGQPTPGAMVVLCPIDDPQQKRPHPWGMADRDGNFRLKTYRTNDGAPAGEYIATVEWRKGSPGERRGTRGLLPSKYATPKESPLRVTVDPSIDRLEPFNIPRTDETAAVGP
jgi:hypothetical protein